MRERALCWGPVLLWAGTVFFLSAQPHLFPLPYVLSWDKLQHCLAYAVGGALLARATGVRGRAPLVAVALGLLYGVSDEIHQAFVRNRSSDVRDWLADAVGVLAGVFLYRAYIVWRARRTGRAAEAART